jgi:hypothetical protein
MGLHEVLSVDWTVTYGHSPSRGDKSCSEIVAVNSLCWKICPATCCPGKSSVDSRADCGGSATVGVFSTLMSWMNAVWETSSQMDCCLSPLIVSDVCHGAILRGRILEERSQLESKTPNSVGTLSQAFVPSENGGASLAETLR